MKDAPKSGMVTRIPLLKKLRWEDFEFKASLDPRERSYLKEEEEKEEEEGGGGGGEGGGGFILAHSLNPPWQGIPSGQNLRQLGIVHPQSGREVCKYHAQLTFSCSPGLNLRDSSHPSIGCVFPPQLN